MRGAAVTPIVGLLLVPGLGIARRRLLIRHTGAGLVRGTVAGLVRCTVAGLVRGTVARLVRCTVARLLRVRMPRIICHFAAALFLFPTRRFSELRRCCWR